MSEKAFESRGKYVVRAFGRTCERTVYMCREDGKPYVKRGRVYYQLEDDVFAEAKSKALRDSLDEIRRIASRPLRGYGRSSR